MTSEDTRPVRLSLVKLKAGVSRHELHMEDRTLVSLRMRLFGVMDGVSTNGGGAEAAALAVNAVHDWVAAQPSPPNTVRQAQLLLAGALTQADASIASYNEARGRTSFPSATTAAILLIFQPARLVQPNLVAVAATVGDSRIMLMRAGTLYTVTLDHSLFADGDLAEAQARQDRLDDARSLEDLADPLDRFAFTHRNVISHALDGSAHADARFYAFRLVPGDRLLVDSDGIHDNLSRADLEELAGRIEGAQQAAAAVAAAAWKRSRQASDLAPRAKPDDMSVIVIDVPDPLLG
jgi:PPM family protein phosphatase